MYCRLYRPRYRSLHVFSLLGCLCLLLAAAPAKAQIQGTGPGSINNNTIDSAGKKTNTEEWSSEDAIIYYTRQGSERKLYPDSSLHTFHRRPFSQPWYRDLGNVGSPAMNLLFTPDNPAGVSLGYHSFDALRYKIDSLPYFNTTRPYSSFNYQLGSKLEQVATILHTQNIKPYWNFAFSYRKINSPGYYFIQRNNHDNAYITSNYASPNQHYKLDIALTYNKEQHDENGGLTSDTFLTKSAYSDRKSIPVNFQTSSYSNTRSPVSNMQRDLTILMQHGYTWGRTDTLYNEDSTRYSFRLTPRFRVSHRLEIGSQRYRYKDLRPDSLRYTDFFQQSFTGATDSVFQEQNWFYTDNRLLLNGLLGKKENQLLFNAGIGNRIDNFNTQYITGEHSDNIVSNYLCGELRKEAIAPGQWDLSANARFIFTGAAAGNFELNGSVGKDLGDKWGDIKIGVKQQLNNAPYSYTTYQNQYWGRENSFNKESTTMLFATINSERYKLSAGVRNYILNNYLYFDETQSPAQFTGTFSLAQVWVRKLFRLGHVVLDNEMVFQKSTDEQPVTVPSLMGRHQLSIETSIFKHKLKIATGIEARYHTNYYANGYSPLFNRFYVQHSYMVSNNPEGSVFFNFRIKRFRAYFMFDQLQQLFYRNTIITRGYAAQNAMMRFGFNWVLIN